MKDAVGKAIKKLRMVKGYTQENMAYDLGISKGAYSKIESGQTDVSVSRLSAIADILEVHVTDFFEKSKAHGKVEDPNRNYGFATKGEIEEVVKMIEKLSQEVGVIKAFLEDSSLKKTRKISKRKK